MSTGQLLDIADCAGRLLIESGAEIYRVEEMMVRLYTSFSEVEDAQSSITITDIMFSITVASKTNIRIPHVCTCGVDLNCIDKINSFSRETTIQNCTIEELALKLREMENEQRYSFWITMFFGTLSVGGFTAFFSGNYPGAGCSSLIGLLIKAVSTLMERRGLHGSPMSTIAVANGVLAVLGVHAFCLDTDVDILIISSIVLLVPGLAITDIIWDTVSGDYLSGITRVTKASLVAIAITTGTGVVLPMSIGLSGDM